MENGIITGGNNTAAEIFLTVIFMIPLYAFLIWTYSSPEDILLLGRRWKYQGDPEISPNVIRYIKIASVFTMIFSPIVLIALLFKPDFFGIALMVFIFGIAIMGVFIILTASHKR
ncbi:hypothetical protein [Sporosarcina sp. Marseille-Q4943]|uniref:hypothetical protein n=1 Tax=Sporosarcina sp. Marseille-Q4943 TaxID=2942204 RepID=UPI00208DC666|nr:hypothetical protein [Sporosarcina sp. Marseille-Q4943]